MASNPYVNKVNLANGQTVMDITDTTALASDVAAGKVFYLATGERVVGTLDVLNTFYPVGSIYTSTSSNPPSFGGTWQEVKVVATNSDLRTGDKQYIIGTGTGTVHYWKRIE